MGAACGGVAGDSPPGDDVGSTASALSAAWTIAGPGQSSASANDVDATLNYDDRGATPNQWDRWTASTTASTTGHVAYAWDYSGLHSWYQAHAKLSAFADGPSGRVTVPLVESGTWDSFGFHGTVELDVSAGAAFGFVIEGVNSDSSHILTGTLRLRTLTPPTDAAADTTGWSAGAAASGPFALRASTAVGRLEGLSGVSATGAATYSIPIQVPPGTRGAAPALSFTYDSQARNGMLGVAFRLAGFPSISRCGPNFVDDGRRGAVRMTAADRFCLDGTELIATQGAYGADGTVYRLHRDDWTTIVSSGACGGGPCSFRATSRGGEVTEFGTVNSSATPASGDAVDATHAALAWSVARQIDVDGNDVQYNYTYASADGEQLPSTILYSANAGTGAPARRAVTFEYEARDDASVAYVGGAKTGLAHRLAKVRTSVDGVAVREYRLAYETRPKTDRSRLHSVKECDAKNVCLPETTFAWSDGSAGFDDAAAFDTKGPSLRSDPTSYAVTPAGVYADFDGDGVTDYAGAACATSDCAPAIWRGGPNGFTAAGFTLPGPVNIIAGAQSKVGGVVVDINGDGRADYVRGVCSDTGACRLDVWRSTGRGFEADVPLPFALFRVESNGTHVQQVGSLADIDGDGVLDYVAGACRSGTCDNSIYLRAGDRYTLAPFSLPGPLVQAEPNGWRVQELGALVDVDGDRISDYVAGTCDELSRCNLEVYRGTGSGFEKAGFSLPGPVLQRESSGWHARQVGVLKDFNGDGIVDYTSAACPSNGGACDRAVFFGTGQGFVKSGFDVPGPLLRTESGGWRARQAGTLEDFNGDGFVDYVAGTCVDGPIDCDRTIRLGSRGGFLPSSATVPAGLFQIASGSWDIKRKGVLIDMNGDGALDYSAATCGIVGSACDTSVRLGRAAAADRLVAITDGFNLRTSFTYAPLTQPGVYTSKAPPTAAGVEARWPLYVVSRHTVDDQKGLKKDDSYTYEQSWSDRARRQWMGFGRVTRTDLVSHHTFATSYAQQDPLAGTPTEAIESDGSGNVLRSSTWTLERIVDARSPAIVRHRPTEERSRVFAPGGAVETSKTYTCDAKDSVTVLVERATGGVTRKTCRAYVYPTGRARLVDLVEEKVGAEAMACGQPWTPNTDLAWRKFAYTANGHLAVASAWLDTASAWLDTRSFYDAYGNAVAVVDANGAASTVDFDDLHTFPVRTHGAAIGNADPADETLVYDPRFGGLLLRTLPSGATFRTQHDTFGRLLGSYGPRPDGQGEVALATYTRGTDAAGPFTARTSQIAWDSTRGAAAVTSRVDIDPWGEVARTTRANGTIVSETARDARGRVDSASAPHFMNDVAATSTVLYDEADRIQTRTDPDGVVHGYTYAVSNGFVTTTIEPSGKSSVTRSGRGVEIARTLPNGAVVPSTTDALDRVTRSVDPTGLAHTVTYDSLGRVTSETTPDSGTTTFAYDNLGRPVVRTDANGKSVRTRFDARGRVVEERIDGPDGPTVVGNVYDAGTFGWGLLAKTTTTQASGAVASEALDYDAYGHVTKRTMTIEGRAFVSSFETTPTGVVDRVTHPDGTSVTTFHDARGLPERIDVQEKGVVSTYATFGDYDAAAKARDVAYLNGVTTRFDYDDTGAKAVGVPLGVTARANGRVLLQQSYGWSSSRWLEHVDDALVPASTRTYRYHAMGYLKDAVSSQGTQTYDYDLAGAFLAKEGVGYTYVPNTHRVATTSDGDAFDYAANGNRTRMSRGGVDTLYDYDADGHLRTVRHGSETRERLEYDGGGNRYSKLDADGTRTLYVSPSDEITIAPSGDELYTLYVHGPHGRVAAITRTSPSGASLSGGAGSLARAGDDVRRMLNATGTSSARTFLTAFTIVLGGGVIAAWATLAWGAGAFASTGARRRRLRAALVPLVAGIFVLTTSPGYAALTAAANGHGRPEVGVVFFHEDPTKSTLLVTGEKGEVVARTAYTPFGAVDPDGSSGQDVFRPKFSGKEWEADAGAYYFGARYYDAKLGSFLSPDVARQYPSAYTYVGNNPRSAVDPDGNFGFLLPLIMPTLMGIVSYAASTPESQRTPAGWGKAIGVSVGVAFAGALAGAALGAGAGAMAGAVAAEVGMSAASAAVVAGVVGGAVGGAADAATSQLLTNAAYERPLDEGLGPAVGIGAGTGAVMGGVGGLAGSRGAAVAAGVEEEAAGASGRATGACFTAGTPVREASGSVKIEDVRLGDRVLTSADAPVDDVAIDPATWRKISVVVQPNSPAEGAARVELLRPAEWLEATHARVGASVHLELAEMGLHGEAEVLAIEPAPPIAQGRGRVVLGTYAREASQLVRLVIDGARETVTVTKNHRFFSSTRGTWITAGGLHPSEQLKTTDGTTVVRSITDVPIRTTVFNIEVDGEHDYFVSSAFVLVHNLCDAVWDHMSAEVARARGANRGRNYIAALLQTRSRDYLDIEVSGSQTLNGTRRNSFIWDSDGGSRYNAVYETKVVEYSRAFDSEANYLTALTRDVEAGRIHGWNTSDSRLYIYSELPICESCQWVIGQASSRLGVPIETLDRNGDFWIWRPAAPAP